MIVANSIESFYLKHKDEIEIIRQKHFSKPITHANLEQIWFDPMFNKQLFKFPKAMNMPLDRMGKLNHYTQFLSKGLSAEEDDMIDDSILLAIDEGTKDNKATTLAKISSLVFERKNRKRLCFHTLIFYNILAVQWVREDENPFEFDEDIQLQKVKSFIEADKSQIGFFFHQPELSGVLKLLQITHEDVPIFLAESQNQVKILQEKVQLINHYHSTSRGNRKTGAKSSS